MAFLNEISDWLKTFLDSIGILAPIFACLLIVVESIFAFLPLSIFIAINFLTFGSILGFLISWIFTILGCLISFQLFRKGIKKWFDKHLREKNYVNKLMIWIEKAKFQNLVVLIALPFTPAFLFNIAAGLSKMSLKKYLFVIIIGKIFLVYFWGFVGTALVESLTNPLALLRVIILSVIAYLIGVYFNKKFGLD